MYLKNLITDRSFIILLFLLFATSSSAQKTDLQRDNLKGKVKSVTFYTDSKLEKKRTYDIRGFETDFTRYCSGTTSGICGYYTNTYDTKGNLVKYIDEFYLVTKRYDAANNLVEQIERHKSGKDILQRLTYTYAGSKKVRSEQIKYLMNSDAVDFSIVIEYIYDSNGNLAEENNISRTRAAVELQKTTYKYDTDKNLAEKKKLMARAKSFTAMPINTI